MVIVNDVVDYIDVMNTVSGYAGRRASEDFEALIVT